MKKEEKTTIEVVRHKMIIFIISLINPFCWTTLGFRRILPEQISQYFSMKRESLVALDSFGFLGRIIPPLIFIFWTNYSNAVFDLLFCASVSLTLEIVFLVWAMPSRSNNFLKFYFLISGPFIVLMRLSVNRVLMQVVESCKEEYVFVHSVQKFVVAIFYTLLPIWAEREASNPDLFSKMAYFIAPLNLIAFFSALILVFGTKTKKKASKKKGRLKAGLEAFKKEIIWIMGGLISVTGTSIWVNNKSGLLKYFFQQNNRFLFLGLPSMVSILIPFILPFFNLNRFFRASFFFFVESVLFFLSSFCAKEKVVLLIYFSEAFNSLMINASFFPFFGKVFERDIRGTIFAYFEMFANIIGLVLNQMVKVFQKMKQDRLVLLYLSFIQLLAFGYIFLNAWKNRGKQDEGETE